MPGVPGGGLQPHLHVQPAPPGLLLLQAPVEPVSRVQTALQGAAQEAQVRWLDVRWFWLLEIGCVVLLQVTFFSSHFCLIFV